MRELPALFSTPMVQALLENRKTMTRRTAGLEEINKLIQKGFDFRYDSIEDGADENGFIYFERLTFGPNEKPTEEYRRAKSKYQVGDYIWVREIWCEPILFDGCEKDFYYKADYPEGILADIDSRYVTGKWKPSLFMPKAAARIWLEVTGVRCERLHDISEADAIAEGIEKVRINQPFEGYKEYYIPGITMGIKPIDSFFSLWMSINGLESMQSNPWVFIYEFKRIEK